MLPVHGLAELVVKNVLEFAHCCRVELEQSRDVLLDDIGRYRVDIEFVFFRVRKELRILEGVLEGFTQQLNPILRGSRWKRVGANNIAVAGDTEVNIFVALSGVGA